jgi:hypothetical protein
MTDDAIVLIQGPKAATLLRDFWGEVDAALRTRGIIP